MVQQHSKITTSQDCIRKTIKVMYSCHGRADLLVAVLLTCVCLCVLNIISHKFTLPRMNLISLRTHAHRIFLYSHVCIMRVQIHAAGSTDHCAKLRVHVHTCSCHFYACIHTHIIYAN